MGLDMYLKRRTSIMGGDRFQVGDKKPKRKRTISLQTGWNEGENTRFDVSKIGEIVEDVGYWRKANAIHAWFVKNVQGGEDECRPHDVSVEKLRDLYRICRMVKAHPNKAGELLPTQDGFFFGSTDYDEYYMQDIDLTISIIGEILKHEEKRKKKKVPGYQYYEYRSSW